MVPDASLRVDEVQRRPSVVREYTPYLVPIVDRDRPGDVHLLQRRLDVRVVVLEENSGVCTPSITSPSPR